MSSDLRFPVVVVGAGPVGATLALELAHHGVKCAVVERAVAPSPHPKMDFVNARSMELLRRLGVDGEIRRRGVPPQHPFTFHWARSLAEAPVAVWESASVDAMWARIRHSDDGSSPAQPYQRLTGSVLEEILRDAAGDRGSVSMFSGWKFDGLEQDSDGVTAAVTGPDGQRGRMRASVWCSTCSVRGSPWWTSRRTSAAPLWSSRRVRVGFR